MTLQTQDTQLAAPQLNSLIGELRQMIDQTRESVASAVNAGHTMLYWQVGSRIRREVLQFERAEYGKKIVAAVARQLALEYGKCFSEKSLRRMIQFSELFCDLGIEVGVSLEHFQGAVAHGSGEL